MQFRVFKKFIASLINKIFIFKYFLFISFFITLYLPIHAGDLKVIIKSPLNLSTVSGETPIDVVVLNDRTTVISKVEIFIDDSRLATLTEPPYKLIWDAGHDFKKWKIRAIAYSDDGQTASQTVYTRKLVIDETEYVFLVNVFVSVKDKSRNFIEDLTKEDFIILEDGVPQRIDRFSKEWKMAMAAIVFDSSLTMKGEKLETAKAAAIKFIDSLEAGDMVTVITFNDEVKILKDFTEDHSAIKEAIKSIKAKGGTALYDAIYRASKKMKNFDGRRIMILLSDGRDESSSGLTPGSLHTFEEAIDKALKNEVMIYSIGVGKKLHKEMDFYYQRSVKEVLEQLAKDTGGLFFPAKKIGALKKAYEMIIEELRHHYSMAYSPLNKARDGSWRKIEVKIEDQDYNIVTRKGYFAPKD